MKKNLLALVFVALFALALALPARALQGYTPDVELSAPAVYLVNLDTNIVVYQKDAETQYQAASLTKLMTVILLMQDYQDQLDTVSVEAPGYIYDYLYGLNASTADILRGETHTLRELLYAMLLPSGNEAAYIVADYLSNGNLENFYARMNAEAEAIGCTQTTFCDPCGLDEGNLISARDAYLLLRTAIRYDAVTQALATQSFDMGTDRFDRYSQANPYTIRSSNAMLYPGELHREYARGGKTGSYGEWQNFAGLEEQDGVSYISVVLNAPYGEENDRSAAVRQTVALVDWAFATFTIAPVLDIASPISELPVSYSTTADTVLLYPVDDMKTLLPADGGAELTQRSFQLPDHLMAPVHKGDVVGTVTLSIDDEKIGQVDLAAGSDVERSQTLFALARIGEFFSGTYFRVLVVLTMLAVAVYAFLWIVALILSVNHVDSGPRRSSRRGKVHGSANRSRPQSSPDNRTPRR